MADNTQLNTGTGGDLLATDDVGGVKYQRVKVNYGVDGAATDVATNAPLPIVNQGSAQTLSVTAGSGTRTFGPIDLGSYGSWYAAWTTTGASISTAILQCSMDNTTWVTVPILSVWNAGVLNTTYGSNLGNYLTTAYVFGGPVIYRYLRIQVTGTTTGTYTFTLQASQQPYSQPVSGNGATVGDAWTPGFSVGPVATLGAQYGLVTSTTWDRLRTPKIFNTANGSSVGNNAIWTPGSGKKFRLMRYKLSAPSNTAQTTGGELTMTWYDGGSATAIYETAYVPAAGGTTLGGWSTGWVDLGNGILSATSNNILNINLSASLTAGNIRCIVAGIEE
jgi:hypothetical protein